MSWPRFLSSLEGSDKTSSARNRFTGIVVAVERDGVMAKVELACGDYRVVSLMSREAADDMGLEPGVPATAVVKSTSVMVEIGRSGHDEVVTEHRSERRSELARKAA